MKLNERIEQRLLWTHHHPQDLSDPIVAIGAVSFSLNPLIFSLHGNDDERDGFGRHGVHGDRYPVFAFFIGIAANTLWRLEADTHLLEEEHVEMRPRSSAREPNNRVGQYLQLLVTVIVHNSFDFQLLVLHSWIRHSHIDKEVFLNDDLGRIRHAYSCRGKKKRNEKEWKYNRNRSQKDVLPLTLDRLMAVISQVVMESFRKSPFLKKNVSSLIENNCKISRFDGTWIAIISEDGRSSLNDFNCLRYTWIT